MTVPTVEDPAPSTPPAVAPPAERLSVSAPGRGPKLKISFELFPPPEGKSYDGIDACASTLSRFDPAFISVTYGAGGTSQERTLAALERLTATTKLPIAGHLTTVGASKEETLDIVDRYRQIGLNHIVALRGDPPTDQDSTARPEAAGFATAAELVAGIRKHVGDSIDISVAAYPETHPRASSAQADLDNLKAKVDAGATRVITQFFFDNADFLRFRDRCVEASIAVPIVAGIMPITSFPRISSFANRCGAAVPAWMHELFNPADSPEVQRLTAAMLAAQQCQDLVDHGVDSFHFYTLNQPQLSAATCRMLTTALPVA